MNKKNIIAAAAMATAGIAGFLIRKKLRTRNQKNAAPIVAEPNRHITKVFSRAKLTATP